MVQVKQGFWNNIERLIQKMERDVIRGRLIAEERAAKPIQTETQLKGDL